MRRLVIITCALLLSGVSLGWAQQTVASATPLTLDNIRALITAGVPAPRILVLVEQRCIDFRMDSAAIDNLTRSGASVELLSGLKQTCSTAVLPSVAASEPRRHGFFVPPDAASARFRPYLGIGGGYFLPDSAGVTIRDSWVSGPDAEIGLTSVLLGIRIRVSRMSPPDVPLKEALIVGSYDLTTDVRNAVYLFGGYHGPWQGTAIRASGWHGGLALSGKLNKVVWVALEGTYYPSRLLRDPIAGDFVEHATAHTRDYGIDVTLTLRMISPGL
jgi:hypothetical protein